MPNADMFIEELNAPSENEENQEVVQNEEIIDPSSPEEVALARKQGWRPADEFKGNPGEYVSAKEFLDRGNQWAHNLKKEVEGLREVARNLVAESARRVAQEREAAKRQIDELNSQLEQMKQLKARAVENADGATVVKIDDQIEATKEAIVEAKTQVAAPQQVPVADAQVIATVNDWKSRNQWYSSDSRAARYANMVGDEYIASHPGAQLPDVLAHVEVETKKVFAQYGKQIPAGPDSGGSERSGSRSTMVTNTRGNGLKWEGLDDAAKRLGDEMIERGVFKNRAEYIDFYSDNDTSTGNVGRSLTKYKANRKEQK